jgi:anti-anti-sigma factor
LSTADGVEKPLLELFDSGFADVVVDLHDVTFMDSSGIRVLITAHQHAENRGARLSILVGTSRVRQTLELSGAIDYLAVT